MSVSQTLQAFRPPEPDPVLVAPMVARHVRKRRRPARLALRLACATAAAAVGLVLISVAVPHSHHAPAPSAAAVTAAYTSTCAAPGLPAPAGPAAQPVCQPHSAPAGATHHPIRGAIRAARLLPHPRHLIPGGLYLFPRPRLFHTHYLFRF